MLSGLFCSSESVLLNFGIKLRKTGSRSVISPLTYDIMKGNPWNVNGSYQVENFQNEYKAGGENEQTETESGI
jgi:hypothetical protein